MRSLLFLIIIFNNLIYPSLSDNLIKSDMAINDEMSQGFDQIIEYYKSKGELHVINERRTRDFFDYLLGQTDFTRQRLAEVVEDLNYDNFKRGDNYKVWPHLEIWRGVDDYGSSIMWSYDGDLLDIPDQDNVIKGQYENYEIPPDSVQLRTNKERQSIKVDISRYPVSLLGYYEYRYPSTALFYAWIAYIWQDIDGHKCGLKVRTVENNSIAMFSLNDFLQGDFSEYMEADYGDKPSRYTNPFSRKLSFVELFLRASQSSYPFNPYENYWRYFEKGDKFMEIGAYEFETGVRTGEKSNGAKEGISGIVTHKDSRQFLLYIRDFINKIINEGWREKLRPINMPQKFNSRAFDFGYWTGMNWSEDQSIKLTVEQVELFEKELGLKLPEVCFDFLRIFNGRRHNTYDMFFPINDMYTVQVKKFYTITELKEMSRLVNNREFKCLILGELVDDRFIGVHVDEASSNYGKMVVVNKGDFEICDYSMETFVKYAQGSPTQPELYAAEQNNAEFLKMRIAEGWDCRTSYQYRNALSQAASFNSHEALKVLLEAGARLKHKKYRQHMKGTYDQTTMEILDQYHNE